MECLVFGKSANQNRFKMYSYEPTKPQQPWSLSSRGDSSDAEHLRAAWSERVPCAVQRTLSAELETGESRSKRIPQWRCCRRRGRGGWICQISADSPPPQQHIFVACLDLSNCNHVSEHGIVLDRTKHDFYSTRISLPKLPPRTVRHLNCDTGSEILFQQVSHCRSCPYSRHSVT